MSIVSFFDQFPEYNGVKIGIRGEDGYFDVTAMSKVLGKRFTDWRKTKFAQELLDELTVQTGIPVDWENPPSQSRKPLIDYSRGGSSSMFVHPYIALSYAMSNPRFQARINIWIVDLLTLGTVNPHYLKWSQEEYNRGLSFNREDIAEIYG